VELALEILCLVSQFHLVKLGSRICCVRAFPGKGSLWRIVLLNYLARESMRDWRMSLLVEEYPWS
jgi:hypothetical protein